jgi:hypothetical protein
MPPALVSLEPLKLPLTLANGTEPTEPDFHSG